MAVRAHSQTSPVAIILQRELEKRSKRNPRFSLRAFARTLDISPAHLSLLLSQKRRPSKKTAHAIADRLALSPSERSAIVLPTHGDAAPTAQSSDEKWALDCDTFALLAHWQHYAILNLLYISSTKLEPMWIAKRLGISEMEASISIQRLKRMGLVEKAKGKWRRVAKPIHYENDKSSAAARSFHSELLTKAMDSLLNDPFEIRDHSSMTVAIDPQFIPYAREKIRHFRRTLADELAAMGEPREVYNITVQIYPVSKAGGSA